MNTTTSGIVLLLGGGLLLPLSACSEEKKTEGATSAKAASAVADEGDKALDELEVTDDDFETAADFEEDAEKTISAENLEKELDALEAEIGG